MTRDQTWGKALTWAEARADVLEFLRRLTVLEETPAVRERLLELGLRFPFGGRQVHDANIVATMLAHSERRLLTFNLADFRPFVSVIELVAP